MNPVIRRLFFLWPFALPSLALADGLHFTAVDALRAEWARTPPPFDDVAREALSEEDQARELLSRQRIGRPGAPPLLPSELESPQRARWQARADEASTPEERFTALALLNRLKSTRALAALDGLLPEDAESWPPLLHLEGQIAKARLRGEEPDALLRSFLSVLPHDPVRAQAAQLSLVLAGKEPALLPPVEATPGAQLAMLEAWNHGPWPARAEAHLALLGLVAGQLDSPSQLLARLAAPGSPWGRLGLLPPTAASLSRGLRGLATRLLEGLPDPAPEAAAPAVLKLLEAPSARRDVTIHRAALEALGKLQGGDAAARAAVLRAAAREAKERDPRLLSALLPSLRKLSAGAADALSAHLVAGSDAIARAAAIEDLARAPEDLDGLARRVFLDGEVDPLQALVGALGRWQLDPTRRRALLQPFLAHPTWIARYEAWRALAALDPRSGPPTPWPEAPPPTATDRAILALARRLATDGKAVRLRVVLAKNRTIVLKLDPGVAPMNVANLVLLARRRFFDGHRVARVVPDFVVQFGSPLDTMDGGPGFAVRCEDSLDWFGPGSVGMALSGKDTGGSQLFITLNAAPHLTGRYTRVGEVEEPAKALPLLDDLELGAMIERIEVIE